MTKILNDQNCKYLNTQNLNAFSRGVFRVRPECVEKWIVALFEPLQQWRGVQCLSEEIKQRLTFREYCRRAKNWFDQRKLIVYQSNVFSELFRMIYDALQSGLEGEAESFRLTLLKVSYIGGDISGEVNTERRDITPSTSHFVCLSMNFCPLIVSLWATNEQPVWICLVFRQCTASFPKKSSFPPRGQWL